RAARALHDALAGRVTTGFDSPLPPVMAAARRLRVVGRTIESVEARGKHLLLRFEGGPVLHTHLGMHGSWHLYRPGSRGRRPPHRARVVVETADVRAVCFDAAHGRAPVCRPRARAPRSPAPGPGRPR